MYIFSPGNKDQTIFPSSMKGTFLKTLESWEFDVLFLIIFSMTVEHSNA